jgi:hypothetical protein
VIVAATTGSCRHPPWRPRVAAVAIMWSRYPGVVPCPGVVPRPTVTPGANDPGYPAGIEQQVNGGSDLRTAECATIDSVAITARFRERPAFGDCAA